MAKRGTLEHPKTLDLAGRLGIMEPFALGLLEAFWGHVCRYYPNGDVSGLRPLLLASSIRFRGDADALWAALIECGFVDEAAGRLIVHDWSDHADDFIHTTLARRCERFADGTLPNSRRLNKDERERFHKWLNAEQKQTDGAESAEVLHEAAEKMTVPSLAVPCHAVPVPEAIAPAAPPPASDAPGLTLTPPPENPKLALVPPSVAKKCKALDPRFTPFKQAIERYWAQANPDIEMPWDGSEAKHLHDFLKACPNTELPSFERMLSNRTRSEIVQSHRPRTWIASLTDYAGGPLDRYGKPAVAPSAPQGIPAYRHVDPDEPVNTLVNEAFRNLAAEYPPASIEQCVAEAQRINAARRHPLRLSEDDLTAAFRTQFEIRARVNRILHPAPPPEVRTC